MRMSQSAQLKALQNLHDKQVDEIKHRTEEQLREKRKGLDKTTGDKEELNRLVLLYEKLILCQKLVYFLIPIFLL